MSAVKTLILGLQVGGFAAAALLLCLHQFYRGWFLVAFGIHLAGDLLSEAKNGFL